MNSLEKPTFFSHPLLLWAVLGVIFALGLGIRLYDLTDPPFDFHPTRQWRSALMARGMYYENLESVPDWQRKIAVAQWQGEAVIEPPVLERLAAWGYRLTGDANLWIPRLLSILFWVSGGVAVYLLGRGLSNVDGGVFAALYFLFLPYGIYASRAFQPDPLMVALIAWALWAVHRWDRVRTLRAAILAGALTGIAIYVKSVAVFMLGGALIGLIVSRKSKIKNQSAISNLKSAVSDSQVWTVGVLSLLPVAAYYVYGLWVSGFLQQQLKFRFFPEMWRDPAFYIRWQEMTTNMLGFSAVFAALLGVLLLRTKAERGLIGGLWIGYALYSLTFPYHTITHDYYQLPLILIVAVSLSALAASLLRQFARLPKGTLTRAVVLVVIFSGIAFKTWDVRVNLARKDYRGDAAEWERFAEIIPPGKSVIALTRAYGAPLAYYGWVNSALWLSAADAELRALDGQTAADIESKRAASLEGKDLFLVTNFNEFNKQPSLKELLNTGYEIYDKGDGYIVFDLNAPK